MRAVNDQTAAEGFRGERVAIDRKLDSQNQALTANLTDKVKFGGELSEAFAQLRASGAHVREKLFVFKDREEFQRGGANQGPATKSGTVQARGDARRYRFRSKYRAKRKARGERLGHQHDVGTRSEFLVSEVATSAPEPALYLIGDEQSATFRGQAASAIPESFGDGVNPAFTLNGFQNDGANGVVKLRFQVFDVVEGDEFDTRHQRGKGQAVLFRRRDAHGAKRAAVKGICHR